MLFRCYCTIAFGHQLEIVDVLDRLNVESLLTEADSEVVKHHFNDVLLALVLSLLSLLAQV